MVMAMYSPSSFIAAVLSAHLRPVLRISLATVKLKRVAPYATELEASHWDIATTR
jgi:hypothetical protein